VSGSGWTAQYYDAVEYYFWGPDKLNAVRRAGAPTTAEAVVGRLKRLEEPLNHLLTLFLDLVPNSYRRELSERCAGLDVGNVSAVADRAIPRVFGGLNVAQPDVLISGERGLLAVEVKLGSPSDIRQVLKYALLLSRLSNGRDCGLSYLTQRPFERHWRDLASPDAVREAALAQLPETERLGQMRLTQDCRDDIERALHGMRLTSWRFSDLDHLLTDWLERPKDGVGAETVQRLCEGMRDELRTRGL
jgi:hypothetical protein